MVVAKRNNTSMRRNFQVLKATWGLPRFLLRMALREPEVVGPCTIVKFRAHAAL